MGFVNEGFRSVINNLKDIINTGDFNKAENYFYNLDGYIEQFIDDLFYEIKLEDYSIIYPIIKLKGYCLYIILSTNNNVNISNNEYKTIIKCTLEILDDNLEIIDKIYKEKF